MVEKEEEILATVLEGLRSALSIAYCQKASDSYMDAIDGAMVAIQERLHFFNNQSQTVKAFGTPEQERR